MSLVCIISSPGNRGGGEKGLERQGKNQPHLCNAGKQQAEDTIQIAVRVPRLTAQSSGQCG